MEWKIPWELPDEEADRLREYVLRETLRYMGVRERDPGRQLTELAQEAACEAALQAQPREIHRYYPLTAGEDGVLTFGDVSLQSRDLARNLQGCSQVCLMAATIGFAPEHLAERARVTGHASRAAAFHAAGAALVEAWCDKVNEDIRREAGEKGYALKPRFSPGYGDFSITFQTQLFSMLEISKRIGVTLTRSLLMMPSKSVTAVIGLRRQDDACTDCGRKGAGEGMGVSAGGGAPDERDTPEEGGPGCRSCSARETCAFRR